MRSLLSLEAGPWQRGQGPLPSHTVDGSWGTVKESAEALGSGLALLLGWVAINRGEGSGNGEREFCFGLVESQGTGGHSAVQGQLVRSVSAQERGLG